MRRRRFLALAGAAGSTALAGCTIEAASESERGQGPTITLEPVVEGVTFPTGLAFLPNGDHLVADRFGVVMRHTGDGLIERPFLDLRDRIDLDPEGEKGLLGMALHPEFADNRRFYVRYSAPRREWMDERRSHTAVLSEFEVTADLTGVVPDSERIVLEIPEPGAQHNAGDLAFGPDGYLYASLGDGQRSDLDEKATGEDTFWWYEQGTAAQNTEDNLLGGILRIDPDDPSGNREYGIPSDNPLVGERGREEYYAWGLRNPFRISFDGEDLYVGDVGEHTRESVYLVEAGDNCGWPVLEGSSCSPPAPLGQSLADNPLNVFNPRTWQTQVNRISPYKVCPTPDGGSRDFRAPIVEYLRPGSRAVTGGFVYRGDRIPELQGQYVFGDFIPPAPLFAAGRPGDGSRPWPLQELVVDDTDSGRVNELLISFARDSDGEVYLLTAQGGEGTGKVRRLAPA
ncbi:sugar dehydrogenase [Halobacteriales archaeon QS_4_66_20]|nr:MAG: sugar dehydrogenase [Halobacteriales archaeon QS_4_66_20]